MTDDANVKDTRRVINAEQEKKDARRRERQLRAVDPEPPLSPSDSSATAQPPMSSEVPPLARLRRILDEVGKEVRSRGLVGEERLAKTIYLVFTSRLLTSRFPPPSKAMASGKSYTLETSRFFPPEAYLEFTGMSEKALVYSTEEYANRTIIIYEVTALREGVEDDMTSYFVRSLLSEGRIDYEVTIRDTHGGFTTKKIRKEGPTNLVFTTTKTQVHAENETRVLSLATDDSASRRRGCCSNLPTKATLVTTWNRGATFSGGSPRPSTESPSPTPNSSHSGYRPSLCGCVATSARCWR